MPILLLSMSNIKEPWSNYVIWWWSSVMLNTNGSAFLCPVVVFQGIGEGNQEEMEERGEVMALPSQKLK